MSSPLNGLLITERLMSLECPAGRCQCHRTTRTMRGLTHCPSHGPDRRPSLSVTMALNGTILIHCFTGCNQLAVWRALFGDVECGRDGPAWDDWHRGGGREADMNSLMVP